ncbi:MAG: peptidylprolyl isomerase [Bacteroidaceae bacterium]|nr:peptidylprolyl isomerase [Bacteroidaceae bacterium]
MKRALSIILSLLLASAIWAQDADPVIMTVGESEIRKSEFEYFYRKNYTDDPGQKNDLNTYADLYLNFKLKVQAAIDEGIDRQESFVNEFKEYRDMQAEEYLTDTVFLEETARQTFRMSADEVGPDGIVEVFILSVQITDATQKAFDAASHRIDSIYGLLLEGEDYRELAAKHSDDGAARNGGYIGWVSRGQLPKEIADIAFSLKKDGQFSTPVRYENYFVIVKVGGHQDFGRYEDHRKSIYEWMRKQESIMTDAKLSQARKMSEKYGWNLSPEDALLREDSLLEMLVPEFGHISREYHDGLLMFEISSREVWEKAGEDSVGLLRFFNANRKKYTFDEPRFKGILIFAKSAELLSQAKDAVKDIPMEEWEDVLAAFNEEEPRIRVMKGPFEKGRSRYSDKEIFGIGSYEPLESWPYIGAVGHIINAPEEPSDLGGQIINDYQDYLEQQWLKQLKKRYKTKVNKKVLKTVVLGE